MADNQIVSGGPTVLTSLNPDTLTAGAGGVIIDANQTPGQVSGDLIISGNLTVDGTSTETVTSAVTVTGNAQPAITSVGTLSGLTVTATITGNISGSAGSATDATNVLSTVAGGNVAIPIMLSSVSSTGQQSPQFDPDLTYNPSTDVMTVGGPVALKSYTKNALPTVVTGAIIFVSNASGAHITSTVAFGNTSNWIDVTTGNIVV